MTHALDGLSLICVLATGPVNVRSHPTPETPGNSIGLEAIIRKALMGKYDDQSEDRSPSHPGSSAPSAVPVVDGRAEDGFSQGGTSLFFLKSDQHFCRGFVEIS